MKKINFVNISERSDISTGRCQNKFFNGRLLDFRLNVDIGAFIFSKLYKKLNGKKNIYVFINQCWVCITGHLVITLLFSFLCLCMIIMDLMLLNWNIVIKNVRRVLLCNYLLIIRFFSLQIIIKLNDNNNIYKKSYNV